MIERSGNQRLQVAASNARVELGAVNVFIGANGSGKSNLLEAVGVFGAAVFGPLNRKRSVIGAFDSHPGMLQIFTHGIPHVVLCTSPREDDAEYMSSSRISCSPRIDNAGRSFMKRYLMQGAKC